MRVGPPVSREAGEEGSCTTDPRGGLQVRAQAVSTTCSGAGCRGHVPWEGGALVMLLYLPLVVRIEGAKYFDAAEELGHEIMIATADTKGMKYELHSGTLP